MDKRKKLKAKLRLEMDKMMGGIRSEFVDATGNVLPENLANLIYGKIEDILDDVLDEVFTKGFVKKKWRKFGRWFRKIF